MIDKMKTMIFNLFLKQFLKFNGCPSFIVPLMLQVESQTKINITETEPGKFSGGFIMTGFPVAEISSTPLGPDKEHPEKFENKTDSNGKKIDYTALYSVWKVI